MDRISIVIPARNSEKTMFHCLSAIFDSLRNSNLVYDITIVLDRCTDQTESVARRFDVKILKSEGSGRSATRNTGARAALAEYVCFLDSDCIVEPDFFSVLIKHIAASAYDWIQCSIIPVSSSPEDWYFRYYSGRYFQASNGTFNLLESVNAPNFPKGDSAGICVRKMSLERVGYFDTRLKRFEDHDLCRRFYLNGLCLFSALDLKVNKIIDPVNLAKFYQIQTEYFFGILRSSVNLPVYTDTIAFSSLSKWFTKLVKGMSRFYSRAWDSSNYKLIIYGLGLPLFSGVGTFLYWRKYRKNYQHLIRTELRQIIKPPVEMHLIKFGCVINSAGSISYSPFEANEKI
jgi:glycosyltransferase involved in cell wall biosynthesis